MRASGQLQPLSLAFARFIDNLHSTSSSPLLLASAVLAELESRGHSCLPLDALLEPPWAAEDLPRSQAAWVEALTACPQVWSTQDEDAHQPLVLEYGRLYLRRYWRYETHIAQALLVRANRPTGVAAAEVKAKLDEFFSASAGVEPDWQKIACALAVRSHLSIITGGPGTGKTYTVARVIALLQAMHEAPQRFALAAPTGKAAARLKASIDLAMKSLELESTLVATTLHKLLGARQDTRSYTHHAGYPLEVDIVIVDESSMIPLEMMAALLHALPEQAILILLGDKDQLASVESGSVLGDLCREAEMGGYTPETVAYVRAAVGEELPLQYQGHQGGLAQQTVMLRQTKRFEAVIGDLATLINSGQRQATLNYLRQQDASQALRWIQHARVADLLDIALEGTATWPGYHAYTHLLSSCPPAGDLPRHEAWVCQVLSAFEQVRILCVLREGPWGVSGLNAAIEKRLTEQGRIVRQGEWYCGRPVMILRNDFALGVANGDVGMALPDAHHPEVLRVYFMEGKQVRGILASRLRDLDTAFAMTVHKSQGSEFEHTLVVLPPEPVPVLTRELIYTGITRTRRYLTLVTPQVSVLEQAIDTPTRRESGLYERIAQGK